MGGMYRFKDEKEFREFMARGNARARVTAGPQFETPIKSRGILDGKPFVATQEQQVVARGGAKVLHPKVPKEQKVGSEIEELLASQIRLVGNLPEPIREYPFLRGRAHRLDFAWPEYRYNGMQLGVEVQGMVHRVKGRFTADLEKRALGLLQNWAILEVGGEQIRSGRAMEWLQEIFKTTVKA